MIFTLIPFFLAANVTVGTINEWAHGPEYTFHAKLTYLLSYDLTEEPFSRLNMTTTVKCRPESSDRLFCRFLDAIVDDPTSGEPPQQPEFDPFLVKFNQRGVEGLLFPGVLDHDKLDAIRSIVKELSVGADFTQNVNGLPAFVAKEQHVLGECATLVTVLEYDDDQSASKQGHGYDLKVLSLPERKPDSIVVIDKRTDQKRCTKQDAFSNNRGLEINIRKSVSKMHISKRTFRSQTEMHVKMRKTTGERDYIVQCIASVELIDIQPAKEKLPPVAFEETATLRFSETMEHNFLA